MYLVLLPTGIVWRYIFTLTIPDVVHTSHELHAGVGGWWVVGGVGDMGFNDHAACARAVWPVPSRPDPPADLDRRPPSALPPADLINLTNKTERQIHSSLGPLMHSTFKMMEDLARFGALMVVLTLGFALAFYAMFGSTSAALPHGSNIAEYDTYYSSLLTLFASMLGNFDFEVGFEWGWGVGGVRPSQI